MNSLIYIYGLEHSTKLIFQFYLFISFKIACKFSSIELN